MSTIQPLKYERLPDWRTRLRAYLDDARTRPHDWSAFNCAQFVLGGIYAQTGQWVLTEARAGFADQATAEAFLAANGGLEALTTSYLGEPLPGVLLAAEGDVLLAPILGGVAVGLCLGHHGAFVGDAGLTRIRLGHCLRAWRA